jgi:hypothetical protein
MNFLKLMQYFLLLNCVFYTSNTIPSWCCGKDAVQTRDNSLQGSDLYATLASSAQTAILITRETDQNSQPSSNQRNNTQSNPQNPALSPSITVEISQLPLTHFTQNSAELLGIQDTNINNQASNSASTSQDNNSDSSSSDANSEVSNSDNIQRDNASSFNDFVDALNTSISAPNTPRTSRNEPQEEMSGPFHIHRNNPLLHIPSENE